MDWTNNQLKHIVADLAQDDAMACRALLEISTIEFTDAVDTMAVSLKAHPTLYINKSFCNKHLHSEMDVKTVLLHEFLHVILGHTNQYTSSNPLLNIATDAIINAIIHRQYGYTFSSFFDRFYTQNDIGQLLRPNGEEIVSSWYTRSDVKSLTDLHAVIYNGDICADDLNELLNYLAQHTTNDMMKGIFLLGNHNVAETMSAENKALLDGIIKRMNGTHIWREYQQSIKALSDKREQTNRKVKVSEWRYHTKRLLEKCFLKSKEATQINFNNYMLLPVLSSSDRRAFSKMLSFPFIPMSQHPIATVEPIHKATVFLDVSGSMNREIEALTSLLYSFKHAINLPLLVFSDDVYQAQFKNNKLVYQTTGGTSIECVFNYIRTHKIEKSLIVTDGYIEEITKKMLKDIQPAKHQFLLSQNSDHLLIAKHRFPFYTLPKLPK